MLLLFLLNILNSCPTQGRVEGWDAMKPRYCRLVNSKGAGRPRLTHHHKGGWNETKWMRWVWRNGGMKFVVVENGRNPEKNLPRPRFVHHETHMEEPRRELGTRAVGGKRLTACATRPPCCLLLKTFMYYSYCQRPSPSIDEWYVVWIIYDGHMTTGDGCGPNFLTFILWLRENPGKNLNQENWSVRGSNPGPLREK